MCVTSIFGVMGVVNLGFLIVRPTYVETSAPSETFPSPTSCIIATLVSVFEIDATSRMVLVFIGAFFDGPGISARQALLPELAQLADFPQERANTAYTLTRRVSGLLGPPIAGLVLTAVGASNLLLVNAVTFAASALIVGVTVPALTVERAAGAVTSVLVG